MKKETLANLVMRCFSGDDEFASMVLEDFVDENPELAEFSQSAIIITRLVRLFYDREWEREWAMENLVDIGPPVRITIPNREVENKRNPYLSNAIQDIISNWPGLVCLSGDHEKMATIITLVIDGQSELSNILERLSSKEGEWLWQEGLGIIRPIKRR